MVLTSKGRVIGRIFGHFEVFWGPILPFKIDHNFFVDSSWPYGFEFQIRTANSILGMWNHFQKLVHILIIFPFFMDETIQDFFDQNFVIRHIYGKSILENKLVNKILNREHYFIHKVKGMNGILYRKIRWVFRSPWDEFERLCEKSQKSFAIFVTFAILRFAIFAIIAICEIATFAISQITQFGFEKILQLWSL